MKLITYVLSFFVAIFLVTTSHSFQRIERRPQPHALFFEICNGIYQSSSINLLHRIIALTISSLITGITQEPEAGYLLGEGTALYLHWQYITSKASYRYMNSAYLENSIIKGAHKIGVGITCLNTIAHLIASVDRLSRPSYFYKSHPSWYDIGAEFCNGADQIKANIYSTWAAFLIGYVLGNLIDKPALGCSLVASAVMYNQLKTLINSKHIPYRYPHHDYTQHALIKIAHGTGRTAGIAYNLFMVLSLLDSWTRSKSYTSSF